MWREYTRELPARRGFALLATTFAFCGSLGLAFSISNRNSPRESPGTRRHLAHWPISFVLPPSFVDVTHEVLPFDNLEGLSQHAVFRNATDDETALIRYQLSDDEETGDQIGPDSQTDHAGAQPIDMGICEGSRVVMRMRGGPALKAKGVTESGLQIEVQYLSGEPEFRSVRALQEICKSIEWQPWSIRP